MVKDLSVVMRANMASAYSQEQEPLHASRVKVYTLNILPSRHNIGKDQIGIPPQITAARGSEPSCVCTVCATQCGNFLFRPVLESGKYHGPMTRLVRIGR